MLVPCFEGATFELWNCFKVLLLSRVDRRTLTDALQRFSESLQRFKDGLTTHFDRRIATVF